MRAFRIAVTGKEGQVARAMVALGRFMEVEISTVGRPQLDLAHPATVLPALAAARPDAIVSAAAYTAVDQAEIERDVAFAINSAGAGAVAEAAGKLGVPVLHLSTDYVFNGCKAAPYLEDDATGPTSAYGASKLDGERRVALATDNHAIFRTAWIYSPYGTNFLKTMLRLAETRESVSVVTDQFGCPTSAEDIAHALILAARRLVESPGSSNSLRGIFHLAGTGEATWADFAREIFRCAESHGRKPVKVIAITSDQYPSPVRRPANSRLSSDKLKRVHGIEMPHWRQSTRKVVNALLGQGDQPESLRSSGGMRGPQ